VPMYDRGCSQCGELKHDLYEPVEAPEVPCEQCGAPTKRVWLGKAPGVKADSIPGGIYIENAICNEDGTPKRYDSWTDVKKAADAKGVVNRVVHTPPPGTDKSDKTSRWT